MSNNKIDSAPFRIDVAEAERLILATMPAFAAKRISLTAAAGQVLAENVIAERDQPPFDRATMDGIAIAGRAAAERDAFNVAGVQAAGAPQQKLDSPADCFEIMTGAVVPENADTVVPVERVTVTEHLATLEEGYHPAHQQFVHHCGSDHRAGSQLLASGTRIRGPEMAILTAAGKADVAVAAWPEIAVISTGDELVDVGEPLMPHQIRSSNDRAIEAALNLHGCERTRRAKLPDDKTALLREIGKLHDECGVLILSGGVSMGKYDYIPAVLQSLGVELVFHKILQRPGLPMWFGISRDGVPVFALPGNPVSTLVCLTRYVIPALQHACGLVSTSQSAVLTEDLSFAPDLCWFLPVLLNSSSGTCEATPRPTNTSGDFVGLRGTSGVIELPRERNKFSAGERFRYWPWQAC